MNDQTFGDIYPSLTYNDARSAIEWLCKAFGFTKRLIVDGPDGSIAHSELSLGNGVIMIGSPKSDLNRKSPRDLPGVNQALSIRIQDPDIHFARAKAAGAEVVRDIQDEDYGSRGYMVRDLEGHLWYFGTYLPGAYWNDDNSVNVMHD